jgi:hypothetical protein
MGRGEGREWWRGKFKYDGKNLFKSHSVPTPNTKNSIKIILLHVFLKTYFLFHKNR